MRKKYDEIKTVTYSKLNSLQDLISKALSEEQKYKLILNVEDSIKKKTQKKTVKKWPCKIKH
jgi:hypothetical protein